MRLVPALFLALGLAATASSPAVAQQADASKTAYEGVYPLTTQATYLTIAGKSYETLIYRPKGWKPTDHRPAIVLFFGGGWRSGSPWQFAPFAAHFSDEGYVVFLPNYRVSDRDNSTIVDSTKDARSALRWVKAHAAEQGVDAARIVGGGGSAGGHIAAALPVVSVNNAGDDLKIDPAPKALLLFNPAANLAFMAPRATGASAPPLPPALNVSVEDLASVDPIAHVGAGYPPCIVFHGTADKTVPFPSTKAFVDKINASGGSCRLSAFEGRDHGFFNLARGKTDFEDTIRQADAFLAEQSLKP